MNKMTLTHLSNITAYDDISCPSKAIKRGMHCPLFGCILLTKYIADMPFLIVGTDECGFYGREIIKVVADDPLSYPVYTYSIEENDVVYGCGENLLKSLQQIQKTESPTAICVVSTCVPELIGEDISGVVFEASRQLKLPIIHCPAHNFGENSHVDGQSDLMAALSELMRPCERIEKSVNLLCGRGEADEDSEITRWLVQNGVNICVRFPGRCTVADIQNAPSASLNIVTDPIGLKLAKKMLEQYKTPYILFGKYADPKRILSCYKSLQRHLKLAEDPFWEKRAIQLQALWEQIGYCVEGKQYIYSNSPLISIDMILMLERYGAKPLAYYVISKNDFERELFPEFKHSNVDPLVALLADFGISERLLEIYTPDFFIGRLSENLIRKTEISCLDFEGVSIGQGFDALQAVLEYIMKALGGQT